MTWDFRIVTVVRVIDGDTVDLELDLGFRQRGTYRFRLFGIDTPERRDAMWETAKQFAVTWFADHSLCQLRAVSHKADNFGRWLAEVYCVGHQSQLNSALLDAGLAVVRTKH